MMIIPFVACIKTDTPMGRSDVVADDWPQMTQSNISSALDDPLISTSSTSISISKR